MSIKHFQEQLQAYDQWKGQLRGALSDYQSWLTKYDHGDPRVLEKITNLSESILNDKITIAFAAEFSRGKTELINAMFFSDTGVRLLPSTPGRTTMCPTELFYDANAQNEAYIKLLSIETRLSSTPMSEYKKNEQSWLQIELDCSDPMQMQEAFKELIAVKRVSVDEAKKLELFDKDLHSDQLVGGDTVEIPCWRHALVSFPHPLLEQGLTILDTPGLNALGSEPELTLTMLPNAQAVVFLLAADTGVTQSDLEMWRHHIRGNRKLHKRGQTIVMNKIDALWDDLESEEGIERSIKSQVSATAKILEVDEDAIFPVSAKQALMAKVKRDEAMYEKSRLKVLEDYLANEVMSDRMSILTNSVTQEIGELVNESNSILGSHISDVTNQLDELRKIDGKNQTMTEELMVDTRSEQSRYLESVENFKASRRVFSVQAQMLSDTLNPEKINGIIAERKKEVIGCLTTVGMKRAMKSIFDDLMSVLANSVELTEENRQLILSIYKKFHEEHGFQQIKPKIFSIKKYQVELEQLFEEGESFRTSATATLMEQGLVVQKLYSSVVIRARDLLKLAYEDATSWHETVLSPLMQQIKEHKRLIEIRLDLLRKTNDSQEGLEEDIGRLEAELAPYEQQRAELLEIQKVLFTEIKEPDQAIVENSGHSAAVA